MFTENLIMSVSGLMLPYINYKITKPGGIHDGMVLRINLNHKWENGYYKKLDYTDIKKFLSSDISTIKVCTRVSTAPAGYTARNDEYVIDELKGFTKDAVVVNDENDRDKYVILLRQEKVADEKAAEDMIDINALYEGITEVYEELLV